jgi:hypothetical protein
MPIHETTRINTNKKTDCNPSFGIVAEAGGFLIFTMASAVGRAGSLQTDFMHTSDQAKLCKFKQPPVRLNNQ